MLKLRNLASQGLVRHFTRRRSRVHDKTDDDPVLTNSISQDTSAFCSNALSNVLWPRRGQRPQLQRYPFRVARLSICTQAPWPTSVASPSASASKSSLSLCLSFSVASCVISQSDLEIKVKEIRGKQQGEEKARTIACLSFLTRRNSWNATRFAREIHRKFISR